ncbi:MAG TPA: BrnA antitoxin family protein [Thiolinea sp.]|nr:BrnA antitoxin family protein [Thiolinea sp.]
MSKKTGTVSYTIDPNNPPALNEQQKAELAALNALPDEAIDCSDIPELNEAAWKNAQPVVGRFYRPIKEQVTVRIDADVLAWLKADGKGYQTRLNKVLREVMEQELHSAA